MVVEMENFVSEMGLPRIQEDLAENVLDQFDITKKDIVGRYSS